MICSNCGKKLSENYRFCQFCGASQNLPENNLPEDLDTLHDAKLSEPESVNDWLLEKGIKSAVLTPISGEKDELREALDGENSGEDEDPAFHSMDIPLLDDDEYDEDDDSDDEYDDDDDDDDDSEEDDDDDEDDDSLDGVVLTPSSRKEDDRPISLQDLPSSLSSLVELGQRIPEHRREGRVCRQCGEPIMAGHKFCGNCGNRYDSGFDFSTTERHSSHSILVAQPQTPSVSSAPSAHMRAVKCQNIIQELLPQSEANKAAFTLYHIGDDGLPGEQITLCEGENIIGRGSSNLLSSDRFVNPKHLRLICNGDEAIIEDFNSLNGVFYKLSNSSTELRNGDIFRIGEELLCYFHGSSVQPILSNQTQECTQLLGGDESPGWGYLRVIMGAFSEGSVYRLCMPAVSLGRTHANIVFPRDGFVSGTHATLREASDHAVLTDLDSSNGTFVRIKKKLVVRDSIFLLIGNQLLKLRHR